MATKRWQGDAVAIAQVNTLTPPAGAGEIGIAINGKVLTHDEWDAAAIAEKWNLQSAVLDAVAQSPEFREIVASESSGDLILTALTPGKPFIVSTTVGGLATSNEVQTLTKINDVSGGTFTVTFDGQTTGNINWNDSSATVQSALEALSNIAPGDVTVTDTATGWQVAFAGAYLATDVPQMTVDSSSLTGGSAAVNEKQRLSLGDSSTAVTFKLQRPDTLAETGSLTTPVSVSDVDTALTALGYSVTCTGGPLEHGGSSTISPPFVRSGWYASSVFSSSSDPRVGNNKNGLLKYTLNVPQGATISAATLTIPSPIGNASIYAEDYDAPAYPISASDASGKSLTTAFGSIDSGFTTFDISAVIQELTDRSGWVSGGSLILHLVDTVGAGTEYSFTGSDATVSVTYSAAGTNVPIVIEWDGGDAGTNIPQLAVTGSTVPSVVTVQEGSPALDATIVPATTIPGGSTIPVIATQPSRGPHHWDDPLNWSGGSIPVSTDDVSIDHSDIDILYGLDQSSVSLASLTIGASFTGNLGLPETNSESSDSYIEYRQQYLKLTAPIVRIGDGAGNGSNLIRLDVLGDNTIDVRQTGSSDTNGLTAVQVISSGNITANIVKGSVGFGLYEGEVAAVTSLKVGYKDTPTGDATAVLGPGATCTTLDMAGGVVLASHAPGTITMTDGELTIDDGNITSLKQRAGTVRYNGNDTITLAEISGVLDFQQDMRAKTVTTLKLFEGFEYHDPHGVVTWTNPCQLIQCSPADGTFDVCKNITLALALL
ncbi:MAG: hypothetical protein JSS49_30110 [Planctomycetes bacterium]|nr:hypothetical protein [Planctomycetota bacterium]